MQNSANIFEERPKLVITIVCFVFIILPLIIANYYAVTIVIDNIGKQNAMITDIDDNIIKEIAEQNNINLSQAVIKKIASEGEWLAISVSSTDPGDFGNTSTMILQEKDNTRQVVFFGTNYNKDEMKSLEIPDSIITKLFNSNVVSNSLRNLNDSPVNPSNKYDLVSQLPYYSGELQITYHYDGIKDDEDIFVPIIDIKGTDATERSVALSKIKNMGHDLGYYRYNFIGMHNPFTEENVQPINNDIRYHGGGQRP